MSTRSVRVNERTRYVNAMHSNTNLVKDDSYAKVILISFFIIQFYVEIIPIGMELSLSTLTMQLTK